MCGFILLTFISFGQSTTLSETFETGLPTAAPSSETTVLLNSGSWKISGAFGKADNGSMRLAMNTNAYAITPAINKPTTISFVHRGSGSGKVITVQKSVNNGLNWTTVGTVTVGSASVYGSASINIGEPGTNNVLIKLVCSSATIFIDNLQISSSDMGDEPTQQASITAKDIIGTSATIVFGKGNGNGRLLVYAKNTASNWQPEDGTLFSNLPKIIDNNLIAAYTGDADEYTVTGLEAGESYHFAVFEYSNDKNIPNYINNNPGRLAVNTLQIPSISISPMAINFGSVKVSTLVKRSFTVSARFFDANSGNIVLSGSSDFQLSTESNSGFSSTLQISYSNSTLSSITVYVQFQPSALQTYQHTVTIAGGGAQSTIQLLGIGSNTNAKVYYISPSGNDNNDGSYDMPWYNLQKAVDAVVPGDTIICRGGVYYPNMKKDGSKTTVRLNTKATADKRITIKNYPGEFPIINFRDQPKKVSVRGIQLNGNYWHIKGLHITEAGDNGMKIEGNYNIVEKCTFI